MNWKRSTFLSVGGAITVLALFVFSFGLAVPVLAVTDNLNAVGSASGLGNTDLLTIIGNIINIFLGLLGVIFLLLTIYAGYLWMTSQGDEEVVTKAKNIIKSATIGLAICLAAFAITTFIINMLMAAIGYGTGSDDDGPVPDQFSDSLGSGGIEDHYPERNATEIPRNTKILLTFKNQINVSDLIVDYDTGADATTAVDDTAPATNYLDTGSLTLTCVSAEGEETVYGSTDITVSFTDNLKTFVFDPPILGSALAPTDCSVYVSSTILTALGDTAISDDYEWSFQVSTELDLTPPSVSSVIPGDGDSGYGRNIITQITFSEAVDPTTASGTYNTSTGGFDKITTSANPEETGEYILGGTYAISSGYKIVEFTPDGDCDGVSVNSCGQPIYCLPGPDASETSAGVEEEIYLDIYAANLVSPVSSDAPAAAVTPYTGVVDLAGNSFDGDKDGTAGDDYSQQFSVTDDVVVDPPVIATIAPSVSQADVDLSESVVVLWDTFMRASTLTNAYVSLLANPDHEMSYVSRVATVDADAKDISASGGEAVASQLTVNHGTFLESTEDDPSTPEYEYSSQLYYPVLPDDIQSLYQNCFYPASGPGATEDATCEGTVNDPNCCDGEAKSGSFNQKTFTCSAL